MDKTKAVYEAAVLAEMKAKATIERHKVQLSKKVAKFEKTYNVSLEGQELTKLDAIKWPGGKTCTVDGQYWDACDIEHKAKDVNSAIKKLAEREAITARAFDKLNAAEKQKEVFENLPAIILEFAERYKQSCITWLLDGANQCSTELSKVDEMPNTTERREARQRLKKSWSSIIFELAGRRNGRKESAEVIAERQRVELLQTLSSRVIEKTGKVTNAKGLRIGDNGEINGYVEGDKGGATISTIIAGGWNIQCLHFRVLVK